MMSRVWVYLMMNRVMIENEFLVVMSYYVIDGNVNVGWLKKNTF